MSKKLKVFKVNKMSSKLKNTNHDLFNYNESDKGVCAEIKPMPESVAVSNSLKKKKKAIPKMNKIFSTKKKK